MDQTKLAFLFGITTGVTLYTVAKAIRDTILSFGSTTPTTTGNSQEIFDKLEGEFALPKDALIKITKHMINEFKRGLASDGQTVKMIPSYVTGLPTGEEVGSYLALDLGGTNFRVCEVFFSGGSSINQAGIRVLQRKFSVNEALRNGSAAELFDYFAECVKIFLTEVLNENIATMPEKKLGFTFSFPAQQVALNKGYLITWTKGFNVKGVEKEEVVGLLQAAFKRKNLRIQVSALVNDTVGTLVSHAYVDPQTYVGVILGTGTNAAYVESIENIPKWKGDTSEIDHMLINTEWGAFDDEHAVIPFTKYDKRLDKASVYPGKQTYEKMISGMYLGEIVRFALLDLIKNGYIFKTLNVSTCPLGTPATFETAFMSRIERDHSKDLFDTKALLEDIFKINNSTLYERNLVKRVCELVGIRAARLSACGIAALVTKINKLDGCTVAIDGSVFEHYPHFGNRMRDALREILGISAENIELAQARDGSGQGAALIAALADY